MASWWTRNPYYLWYMFREASCVFIVAYALVLLVGLARLSQGEGAFEGWLESLTTPWALAFHILAFVLIVYHTWTWFKIMPRTMPFVRFGGTRVPDPLIVAGGLTAAVIVSVALVMLV